MRFEPTKFINMARRHGITLTRIGNDIKATNVTPIWGQAIKKHKRRLLKHLPEDSIKRLQMDLFIDD